MDQAHEEVLLALWRAAEVTRGRLARVAEAAGVTFQQLTVLRIVASEADAGIPTLEISRRMAERAPAITGLLDRLERQGLVERVRSSADRRQVRCRLTAEGRALVDRVTPGAAEASREAFATLTGHELGVLRHLTQRLARQ